MRWHLPANLNCKSNRLFVTTFRNDFLSFFSGEFLSFFCLMALEAIREDIAALSQFTVRPLNAELFRASLAGLELLLHAPEARAARLDRDGFSAFLHQLAEDYDPQRVVGCVVLANEEHQDDVPMALAIATREMYLEGKH